MPTHLDTSLVAQIHEAQFEYLRGRMEVMRAVRGESCSTRYFEAEHVRACVAPGVPNPFFNQVFISGPAARQDIEGAEFGTSSLRNLERSGLQSRYMVAIWTKGEATREP